LKKPQNGVHAAVRMVVAQEEGEVEEEAEEGEVEEEEVERDMVDRTESFSLPAIQSRMMEEAVKRQEAVVLVA